MPPGLAKRLFSQTIPEPIPEIIQGTSVVVIHPGSQNLRIGRASDPFPVTLPHCIAWRSTNSKNPIHNDTWLLRPECRLKVSEIWKNIYNLYIINILLTLKTPFFSSTLCNHSMNGHKSVPLTGLSRGRYRFLIWAPI